MKKATVGGARVAHLLDCYSQQQCYRLLAQPHVRHVHDHNRGQSINRNIPAHSLDCSSPAGHALTGELHADHMHCPQTIHSRHSLRHRAILDHRDRLNHLAGRSVGLHVRDSIQGRAEVLVNLGCACC